MPDLFHSDQGQDDPPAGKEKPSHATGSYYRIPSLDF